MAASISGLSISGNDVLKVGRWMQVHCLCPKGRRVIEDLGSQMQQMFRYYGKASMIGFQSHGHQVVG
jgi:hypothetical protein